MRTTQNERGQGGETAVTYSRREEKDRHRTGARPRRPLPRALRAWNGPAGSSSSEPQRGTAHRTRSDRGHHGLLHVPRLRARPAGQGRADHGRDPGRGAELGAELLELRPERPLQVLGRQQRGRQGGRRRARVPLQDRADPRHSQRQFTLPLSYVGGAGGLPPITALDGPGSEGLGLRQRYTVTLVRGHHRTQVARRPDRRPVERRPRTMPDYAALAAQGTYDLGNGIKVFAGQREDPFYIDLGGVFDTLNLRRCLRSRPRPRMRTTT